MKKEKEYKGYFRKGWFLYTLITILSTISALGFIYLGMNQGGSSGFMVMFSGFMSCVIGGALMRVMICAEYIDTGEDRL